MKMGMSTRLLVAGSLFAVAGSIQIASAAGTTLSVRATPLGNIIVNSQGMTAYYYDLDTPNSGVSVCTGKCLVNWPAITTSSARLVLVRIKGQVTVLAGTHQLAINGRPIYTFIGDTKRGSTKGQGIGKVWFAISPTGAELKPTAATTPSNSPTPATSSTPAPAASPTPTASSSTGTNTSSNY